MLIFPQPLYLLRLMHKSIFYKNILVQSLMTSSVEWLNGTPRADFAILTFAGSTTAQLRKNKFFTIKNFAFQLIDKEGFVKEHAI